MKKGGNLVFSGLNFVSRSKVARYEMDAQVETWSKHWDDGQLCESIEALNFLVNQGAVVPRTLLSRVLKRCIAQKNLVLGRCVHALTVRSGYESNTFLANHIIRMYASHGKLEEATQVFNNLPTRDTFMWYSLIKAHVEHGQPLQATNLYRQMRESMVKPNNYIFVPVLQACASAADLVSGKEVHADILGSSEEPDIFVGNCLVDMYSKCGSLVGARKVFDNLPTKNVVTWNCMIAGYIHHGFSQEALTLYESMQKQGITRADNLTFSYLLKACARVGALHQGKQLHAQILERGFETDVVVTNSLVGMYGKCGSLDDARCIFDGLPTRDVAAWNAMITGYTQRGLGQEALTLYANMQQEANSLADHFTFAALLKACASIGALNDGKQLHAQIQERGLEADVVVGSSLVDMYTKCGSLVDARSVFDTLPIRNVVTWNAMITGYVKSGRLEEARQLFDNLHTKDDVSWATMISGYAQQGMGQEALTLFARMQEDGMNPTNQVTFVSLVQACAAIGALPQGKQLHQQIQEMGLEVNVFVGNCLVDMYAKCGSIADARRVFDRLPSKDVVTWTAMIAGYVHHGLSQEALALYATMQKDSTIQANHVTFVCLLQACASVGALLQGKQLHSKIRERGLEADVVVGNCLVDMYAKCGSLEDARTVFDRLPAKTVVTWNALMNGYAQHSDCQRAIRCYEEMQGQGVDPDDSTFISLLVACSHVGLVNEGQRYFNAMEEDYGIAPTAHHYTCMVDLLGRSGHLNEAESMLQSMPFQDDIVCWTSLLSACKSHGDVERGRRCFDHITRLQPGNATPYVLMTDIYASAGRWKDVDSVKGLRKAAGAQKKPARASIEVHSKVHWFAVGEERDDIASKLKSVNLQLNQDGSPVPHVELVLKGARNTEEEDALCGHAEKLALAYGLLNTPNGTTLLVTKNLRMCNDCHNSTKVMSGLEKRDIVVRDAHRVHHFVDGSCSCGDRH